MHKLSGLLVSFLFLVSIQVSAQISVVIDKATVVNQISSAPAGVVLNQMTDGAQTLGSLQNVVIQSGSKRLRFPEGESADNYYFTDPSLINAPDPSTHRVANTQWWPAGSDIADANGHYTQGLNFDQFMAVAQAAGASTNVVLCYPCGDKVQALEMAKAWVKYSKDKGYNVLNWEIGNETYSFNADYTDLYQMTVNEYAKDVIEWSNALKAIDPRIKIGVNGSNSNTTWYKSVLIYKHPTLLTYGAQAVDFLSVHSYEQYNSNFANYQLNKNGYNQTLDLAKSVKNANAALTAAAATTSVSHITLQMTESGTINYAGDAVSDPNNLGSAIMTSEMIQENLRQPKMQYVELWASRWVDSFPTAPGWDTFSPTNTLNPSGLALRAASKFTGNQALSVTGATTTLRAFATKNSATGITYAYLINRSNSAQSVKVSFKNSTAAMSGQKFSITGSSPSDLAPVFDEVGTAVSGTSSITLSVPATSVIILSLNAPLANLVANPGFENGLVSWTEDWGGAMLSTTSSSGMYSLSVTAADGGGMGQLISGLVPGATYKLYATTKNSGSDGAWFGISFLDANGNTVAGGSFSSAITGTTYTNKTVTAVAPANFVSAQVWIWKDPGSSTVYIDDVVLQKP